MMAHLFKRQRVTSSPLFLLLFLTFSLALAGAADTRLAGSPLAKFEPEQGCYVGAFIERDLTFLDKDSSIKMEEFEQLTKKKHASYFTYVGYGQPFPAEWVAKVKKQGAAPHIAFEPNDGLDEVRDDDYLRAWARDAARARCPIFLRWASEMNGPWTNYSKNPALYREKFRLMYTVMHEEAPNVALVWTPFAEPQRLIPQYYPGDEYVDWVGVNIYSVYVNNGDPMRPAWQQDPLDFVRYVYENYSARKPIHISEFAATIRCKGTGLETVQFAIEKMTRFYNGLRQQFPRVKAVNWFCLDTIRSGLAHNDYSLLQDGRVLAAYRRLVADDYFLSRVQYNPADFAPRIGLGTTVGPRGIHLRQGKPADADLLARTGAVSTTLEQPYLRGIENGEVVRGDLELRAQLPLDLQPRGLIWQVDGRTVALTNTAPYRISVPQERLASGHHTARVLVLAKDEADTQYASPEVEFDVVE
jgi:Glycosyl hydrolase family 26